MASIHADSFSFALDASSRRRARFATGGFSISARKRSTATYSDGDAGTADAGAPAKLCTERPPRHPNARRTAVRRSILLVTQQCAYPAFRPSGSPPQSIHCCARAVTTAQVVSTVYELIEINAAFRGGRGRDSNRSGRA